jgi:hypothetical protein
MDSFQVLIDSLHRRRHMLLGIVPMTDEGARVFWARINELEQILEFDNDDMTDFEGYIDAMRAARGDSDG